MTTPRRFRAQVAEHIKAVKGRLEAVHGESTQRLLEQANRPTAKGGRMRVDTAFLRNSLFVSLSGMPSGPSRGDDGNLEPLEFSLEMSGLALGDTIYAGWTANYARWREYEDGFMRGAAENWQQIVDEVARELEARTR